MTTAYWVASVWLICSACAGVGYLTGRAFRREELISYQLNDVTARHRIERLEHDNAALNHRVMVVDQRWERMMGAAEATLAAKEDKANGRMVGAGAGSSSDVPPTAYAEGKPPRPDRLEHAPDARKTLTSKENDNAQAREARRPPIPDPKLNDGGQAKEQPLPLGSSSQQGTVQEKAAPVRTTEPAKTERLPQ